METILYEDYIFHTDVKANRRSYAQRPAARCPSPRICRS